MERRKFLAGSGTVGVGVAAAALMVACGKKEEPAKAEPAKADAAKAGAPAVATGEVRWRLASSFPKSLDTLFGAAETFAKAVTTASGGKFTVTAHAAGELVPPFGVVDAVQNGFRPIVIRECVGDRHDGPHEANLFDINAKYGDVISKADAMQYIKGLKKS